MFKVKWGTIERHFRKTLFVKDETPPVKLYFDAAGFILCFLSFRGTVLYSELGKEFISDVNAFKMEYLSDAYELVENPIKVEKKEPTAFQIPVIANQ